MNKNTIVSPQRHDKQRTTSNEQRLMNHAQKSIINEQLSLRSSFLGGSKLIISPQRHKKLS